MVMAQSPNTQYVAHEFVRQYYTMLHKDPSQLHRFYTKDSCLTHGGSPNAKSEEPVCGQEAIYEKIAQLNFRNCHAKIRSVDSHPTIGGGVVIQVNGELSNSGMAMRKFMQTFVLAQQEPKKYHVLNDIFRYQDETFEDTENDETIDGTVESENGYQSYEPVSVAQMETIPDRQEVPVAAETKTNDYGYSNYMTTQHENSNDEDVEKEEKLNGPSAEDAIGESEEPVQQESEYFEPEETEQQAPEVTNETTEANSTDLSDYESTPVDTEETTTEEAHPEPQEPEGPPKPFTWAALAKKNTPSPITPVAAPAAKPPPKKPSPSAQRTQKKREEPAPAVVQKKDQPEDSRRRNPAPDNHQIFIGNLPSNVTEKDVRDAFDEFGTIVEIRLNPKNFGFIAFDGPDAPTKILNKTKNIVIHTNTINTEVKRSVSGSGRGGGGGGGGGGGNAFRRGGSDKEGRGERRSDNKNTNNRNAGGQNRSGSGKSNSFGQKQRNSDDGKTDNRNKDLKAPREQRPPRR